MKPPNPMPRVLMKAIPPAAAVPPRIVGGKAQNGPCSDNSPTKTNVSAMNTTRSEWVTLATSKPAIATKAGSATCQMRSPLASLEWPHRIMATMLARNGSATTKPVASVENPIACTI